ncbi:MAG: VWA domain-containing protein [Desulfurococcaceae archaeon]
MNSYDYIDLMNSMKDHIDSSFSEIYSYLSRIEKRTIDRDLVFIKMFLTLKSIVNNDELEKYLINELIKTLYSNNVLKKENIDTFNDNKIVYSSNMRILKKIHGRRNTTISQILSDRINLTDILDYIWLRKEGYLNKKSNGLYVNPSIHRLVQSDGKRVINYRDVVKYLNEIPSRFWKNLLSKDFLKNLNNRDFIELLDKVYGYNSSIDQDIVSEIERRFENGWIPDWNTWLKIEKKIRNSLFNNRYLGPYSFKWIEPSCLSKSMCNRLISDLNNLPLRDKWRLISSICNSSKYDNLLEKLDPITLSVVKNFSKHNVSIKNKALIGQSIVNYVNYLISGESSYLEYSKYILTKIDVEQLDPRLKPLYRSLLSGDYKYISKFLSRMYGIDTVELIANSVWNIFNTRGVNQEVLWRAVKISYEILKYRLKGLGYASKYKYSSIRGRLVVRKTVFNIIRSNYTLIRETRDKEVRLISVVDTSGSMIKYSLWTILALSSIIRFVKFIYLFSDKVVYSKPPRSFTKPILIKYLENLFIEGFKGYTNISKVFRELRKHVCRRDVVVLISDLEQTVPDKDPVLEIKSFLESTGSRLIIFTPPRHSYETRLKLENIGVDVVVVRDPSSISKLLKKKLNLKI